LSIHTPTICTQDAWNSGTPFTALLAPSLLSILAFGLLAVGSVAAGTFAVLPKKSSVVTQIATAVPASLFLGFGTLFTFLAVGIYV